MLPTDAPDHVHRAQFHIRSSPVNFRIVRLTVSALLFVCVSLDVAHRIFALALGAHDHLGDAHAGVIAARDTRLPLANPAAMRTSLLSQQFFRTHGFQGRLGFGACGKRAARRQLQQLAAYLAQGHQPGAVIANSIAGGYQGLYPPRVPARAGASANRAQRLADWTDELRDVLASESRPREKFMGTIDATH